MFNDIVQLVETLLPHVDDDLVFANNANNTSGFVSVSETHRRLLDGGEHAGGLHHVVDASIAPFDVGGVPPAVTHSRSRSDNTWTHMHSRRAGRHQNGVEVHLLVEDGDAHAADDQLAPFGLHLAVLPCAVGGVVLEHVDLPEEKNK